MNIGTQLRETRGGAENQDQFNESVYLFKQQSTCRSTNVAPASLNLRDINYTLCRVSVIIVSLHVRLISQNDTNREDELRLSSNNLNLLCDSLIHFTFGESFQKVLN
jgi:hypothetical protein